MNDKDPIKNIEKLLKNIEVVVPAHSHIANLLELIRLDLASLKKDLEKEPEE